MKFDSLDAVRAFGSDRYEEAVIPEQAPAMLNRFETHWRHYEVRSAGVLPKRRPRSAGQAEIPDRFLQNENKSRRLLQPIIGEPTYKIRSSRQGLSNRAAMFRIGRGMRHLSDA